MLNKETLFSRTFEECEFENCEFIDCKIEECKFLECHFNNCVLSAIDPKNSRFQETAFKGSKVIGFDWTKTRKAEELSFSSCQINYSNFKLLKIPGTKIIDSEAREVDFIETDLSKGIFKGTDFEKSRFFKTDLSEADFRKARNYYIDVKNNVLKKTRFSLPEALVLLDSLDIIIE